MVFQSKLLTSSKVSTRTLLTCTVFVHGERTDPFPVNTGVRQGCILSPILFSTAIDFATRITNETKTGIKWKDDNCLGTFYTGSCN